MQRNLWNEANAKLNEVATLYASGSADAKIKQYVDNLVKMHCQTIDSIRDGNPQEAIAAFKANSALQKVTLLACDQKITSAIAPEQLDMILTPATQLAQTGFAAAKTGNLERSITITDAAHGIADCVKAVSHYAVDFAQKTVERNAQDLKLAGEAIKYGATHPIETLAKLCEVTVKAAAILGEYDTLNSQVLNDKARLEKMVIEATEFTKVLNEATQHVSNMSWQERLETAAEITVDTMIFNKALKAIGTVHSLATKQTQLLLGKLGNAQAVLNSSKALITAEEGLATAIKTKSGELAATKQVLHVEAELEAIRQSVFNRTKDITIEEAHKLGFRAPEIDKLRGFDKITGRIEFNTEWQGGMEKAKQVFESLKNEFSCRKVVKEGVELKKGIERIFYEFSDGSKLQFRSLGKSGHPKIEILDTLKNIEEKITFK